MITVSRYVQRAGEDEDVGLDGYFNGYGHIVVTNRIEHRYLIGQRGLYTEA